MQKDLENDELSDREMRKFGKEIFDQLVESALINGHVKPAELSDFSALHKKIRGLIPENDDNFYTIIMYGPTLLDEAERFKTDGHYELAFVLFATYFEHFINEVLSIWGARNVAAKNVTTSLIRKLSLEDKYTWTLQLLKMPGFSAKHFLTIKQCAEIRNAYIHYKYEPILIGEDTRAEIEFKKMEKQIKAAVRYTKQYRTKLVFDGEKSAHKRNLSKRKNTRASDRKVPSR